MAIFNSASPYPSNCTSISNQGSMLLVGDLVGCAPEPEIINFTMTVNRAIGSQQITVVSSTTASKFLRKGTVLRFSPTATATVVEDILVAGSPIGNVITVEPLLAALNVGDVAPSWCLLKVLSPQTIPVNEDGELKDVSDLSYGTQRAEIITRTSLTSQVQIISRANDKAFHQIIAVAAKRARPIFVAFILSDESHVFGKAFISSLNRDFTQMAVNKPSFTLNLVAPWFSYTAFSYETSTNRSTINNTRKHCGLNSLAVTQI